MPVTVRTANRNDQPSAGAVLELKRITDRIDVVTKQIAIHKAELKYLKTYLSKLTGQTPGK